MPSKGSTYVGDRWQRVIDKLFIQEGTSCWLWHGPLFKTGYGRAGGEYVHRLVWEALYGDVPRGMEVCHTCDEPRCANPAHLSIGSHAQNLRDMGDRGRSCYQRYPNLIRRGEDVNTNRLSAMQVLEIRSRYASGESQYVLARAYGVTRSCVCGIVSRRTWRHL